MSASDVRVAPWLTRAAILMGGMIGGGARLGLAELLNDSSSIPLGTMAANLVGALVLGDVLTRLAARTASLAIPFFCVGVLGSFTTFSALSLETWQLIDTGRVVAATVYGIGSLLLGLLAAATGMRMAERRP